MKNPILEALELYDQTPIEARLREEYLKPEEEQDKELIKDLEAKIDGMIDEAMLKL